MTTPNGDGELLPQSEVVKAPRPVEKGPELVRPQSITLRARSIAVECEACSAMASDGAASSV